MTRVKICGLTNHDDAFAALEAGADLLGFVFAASPRQITPSAARAIIDWLQPSADTVGVFKDDPLDVVLVALAASGIKQVQLHGDESSTFAEQIHRPVIRRIKIVPGDKRSDLQARIDRHPAAAHLLDPGAGDGQLFDWNIARDLDRRIFLAGGLTPENVAEAIRIVRPDAVDVASGVEAGPGRKDRRKMIDFIQAVRSCDAEFAA